MARVCPFCGVELKRPEARFCSGCGKRLPEDELPGGAAEEIARDSQPLEEPLEEAGEVPQGRQSESPQDRPPAGASRWRWN